MQLIHNDFTWYILYSGLMVNGWVHQPKIEEITTEGKKSQVHLQREPPRPAEVFAQGGRNWVSIKPWDKLQ